MKNEKTPMFSKNGYRLPTCGNQGGQEFEKKEPLEDAMSKAQTITESLWLKQLSPAIKHLQTLSIDLSSISKVQIDLQRNIGAILSGWQSWYSSFAPLAQVLSKWQQQIAPILQNWAPVLLQVDDFLKKWPQLIEEEKEIAEAFKDGHLLLAPSMPVPLVRHIKSLCKSSEFRKASRIIGGYYRKNGYSALDSVIEGWSQNRYFQPRMIIILDAFEAHKQRKYTLSIPTLLPQIEGIASDISKMGVATASKSRRVRLGKTKLVVRQLVEESHQPFGHAILDTLLAFIEEPLYKSRDFETEYGIVRKHTGLSRHGILHGLQIRYANYTNSLRLFLVLDILCCLAEDIEKH